MLIPTGLTLPGLLTAQARGGGQFATLWNPSDEAGLQIWLKAGQGITTDVNGVATWADQSGNGRDATVGDNRYPQETTSYFGGVQAVLFGAGAVADELNVASGMSSNIFYALRPTVTYGPSQATSGLLARTGTTANFRLGATSGSFANEIMWGWRGSSSFDGVSSTALAELDQSEHVLGHVWNGSSYGIFVDGSDDLSDLATGAGTTQMSGVGVFGSDGSGGAPLQAAIAEIIVFNSIDITQRQKIEGYLAHRYGFASVLPVAHPYKSAAPLA